MRQRTREAESLAQDIRATAREVRRIADEQAALRRMATLMVRGAPSETFSIVAAEMGRLFGADVAVVFRYARRYLAPSSPPPAPGVARRSRASIRTPGVGSAGLRGPTDLPADR